MNSVPNRISDADLHGIVDGHLDADRRADILRRVAASSTDRALIESWQHQNDILRSAFRDVEREPIPAALDLLRAATANPVLPSEAPEATLPAMTLDAASSRSRSRFKGGLIAGAAVALCAVAAIASIVSLDGSPNADTVSEARLRGSIDDALAVQALSALLDETGEGGAAKRPLAKAALGDLPTAPIPDLQRAGFGLTLAETSKAPAALVFHYENAAADHVTISVARTTTPTTDQQAPAQRGGTFGWHKGGNAYAIAGTMPADEVRALAVALLQRNGE